MLLTTRAWTDRVHILVAAAVLLASGIAPAAAADGPSISLTSAGGRWQEVSFDSDALGRRTTALLRLPDGYRPTGRAWPTAYFLHGETAAAPTARAQVDSLRLDELAAADDFVFVAPDISDTPACANCAWLDDVDGAGIAAETHVQDELLPMIESLLHVRRDRGGRALLGTSMGGTGALVQAFRQPDRFGFVGALSPLLDLATPLSGVAARYETYLTAQGLAPLPAGEIQRRNVSPLTLAPQMVWANVDITVATVADEDSVNNRASALLAEIGLPWTHIRNDGARFSSDAQVLRDHVVESMLDVFDAPRPLPERFSYKTVDTRFSVWGHDITVDRGNHEFLTVLGARRDGTELTLAGTGSARVTSPPSFRPGRTYDVGTTADPRSDDTREAGEPLAPFRTNVQHITADSAGRLTYDVALRPARPVDESTALLYAGAFETPHVQVRITDPAATQPAVTPTAPTTPPWLSCTDTACALPAPFDAWTVRVTPWTTQDNVLTLDFDSPALGFRTRSYVHLPDAYFSDDRRFPVVYYLHGTATGSSGKYQSWNMGFQLPELRARQQYLVVAPDMGDTTWCGSCYWVDPLEPRSTVPNPVFHGVGDGSVWPGDMWNAKAETHVLAELVPLIEAMFRVRTDRGGRGIIGNSMGASSSLVQGFRHPDLFSFVGALSGVFAAGSEESDPLQLYCNSICKQGYTAPRQAAQAEYRSTNPLELGIQSAGADPDVIASIGDGCVDPDPSTHCSHTAEAYVFTETYERRDDDRSSPLLTQQGVPHTLATYHGTHYWPDGDVYSKWYVDRINARFARPVVDPFRISYKTVDRRFSVWGYDVSIDRTNAEFLNLIGARLDARSFTLAGTGRATVVTPAAFSPDRDHLVRISDESGLRTTYLARSDSAGRLRLTLDLAAPHLVDERIEYIEAGQFDIPQTRVEIVTSPASWTPASASGGPVGR